jgi:hypothetical protein
MFATSKIFRFNFEPFTWNTRNMSRTWMQHVRNDCNMKDKQLHHEYNQLQHAKNIVATPIYTDCNIPKSGGWGRPSLCAPVTAAGAPPAPATTMADDKFLWPRLGTGCATADGGWGGVTLALEERLGTGGAAALARRRLGPWPSR